MKFADGMDEVKITIHSNAESAVIESGRATPMAPGAGRPIFCIFIKAKAEDGVAITIAPYKAIKEKTR
ncbi:MAG: hypothetical protein ACLTDG_13580 [Lachnospiraceae bacterium]